VPAVTGIPSNRIDKAHLAQLLRLSVLTLSILLLIKIIFIEE
jgi:hypothetical protein